MRGLSRLVSCVVPASLFVCAPAIGQPRYPPSYPPSSPPSYPQPLPVVGTGGPAPGKSLKAHIGLDAARALLTADDPKARVRGVERLGGLSDPQAVDTLVEALDPGTILSRDLEARLAAVRVLADHANRPEVRAYLVRELSAAAAPSRAGSSMGALVRGSAAMALARQGDEKCLEALLTALEQRGAASEAARAAFAAYPPRTLDPLLFVSEERSDESKNDDEPITDADGDLCNKSDPPPQCGLIDLKESRAATPPDTKKLGKKGRALSVPLIDMLGDLGDLRALASLRMAEKLASAQPETRAHAALALARMGDDSGAEDARRWARSSDTKLVELAGKTLILLDDWTDEAPPPTGEAKLRPRADGTDKDPLKNIKTPAVRAVGKLLGVPATRRAAMDLIADSRAPDRFKPLVDQLVAIAHEPSGDDRSLAILTLVRVEGGWRDVEWLSNDNSELAHVAAYALANIPGGTTTTWFGAALEEPASPIKRRLLVRAAVIRFVALGAKPSGLVDAARALSKSTDEADIEVAAFAQVALGARPRDVLGKTPKPAAVAGAARAALLIGESALADFAPLLRDADDGQAPSLTHVAAGIALLLPEAQKVVPQKTLLAWVESGGALAPLAAYALPARDDDAIHPRIKELLLEGTDPVVRAHIALGLSQDSDPSVTSLLVSAYMTDVSPLVRRAAIRALSRRTEPQRERALQLARELDPDETVRSLAARAMRGRIEETPAPLGLAISWTKIEQTRPPARMVPGRYLREDGFALPFVSGADGELLEPAPSFGPASISIDP